MAELLESVIDKATDPERSKEGVDYVTPVCDRINLDLDGPVVGIRYLVTKVKSAKEEEALLGLNVIEACVQNCGQRFHSEVGKYRFINELIKLISSKYDGDWTPDAVKKRIVEILYGWTLGLPNEPKIAEAYKMLKQQGIVTKDPEDPFAAPKDPAPEPRKDTIFEDEEKSKLLARLLKSSHPEDLQAANRLIKTMVRQDELKVERQVKRDTEIETCCNNIKLLTEMLNHFSPSSPSQDKDLMKELYDACDKMRPQLFRLASSATEDGDEGLAEILRVNDDLSRVLEFYRKIFGVVQSSNPESTPTSAEQAPRTSVTSPGGASTLIDLGAANQSAESVDATAAVSSVLENELKALGLHDLEAPPASSTRQVPMQGAQQPGAAGAWGAPAQNFGMLPPNASSMVGVVRPLGQLSAPGMPPPGYMASVQLPRMTTPQPMGFGGMPMAQRAGPVSMGTSSLIMASPTSGNRSNFSSVANKRQAEEAKVPNPLDILGQEVLQSQKQQQKQKQTVAPLQEKPVLEQQKATGDSLLSLGPEPSLVTQPVASVNLSSTTPASFPTITPPPKAITPISLDNVFVPLDTIKPGSHPPLTVLDKNNIRVIFHFAKTSAELSRSDMLIVVVSSMSSLPSAVTNFVFQAAVPKTMKVKLQPPSGSELPAYNPILPPSAITQVMLIANPAKEKVRLKYKVSYQVDGLPNTETGEVDSFPSAND
ncbi:ADP-ribosylation factor-binding protein GGA2-like [Acropora millepora]|uniref:ADP-ribosylation factor-binding protein GGA2-like n=1 Tax=Acropora millepora TaxID=45264 RepID=UPI001CF51061|nr:ADP-ribosylation factor-binding protein GGA2-like [Acropora millepora]